MKIAIVASRFSKFNAEIVDRLVEGATDALLKNGLKTEDITLIRVPGAFEIPLAAQAAAVSKKFDGIIALGCVIRGETPHFEYFSRHASAGIGRVALDHNIPVAFGILTVDTEAQAAARAAPGNNKGAEAAMAAIEMVNLLKQL